MDQSTLIAIGMMLLSFFSLIALSERFRRAPITPPSVIRTFILDGLETWGELSSYVLYNRLKEKYPASFTIGSAHILPELMNLEETGWIIARVQVDPDGRKRRYYRSAHKEMEYPQ